MALSLVLGMWHCTRETRSLLSWSLMHPVGGTDPNQANRQNLSRLLTVFKYSIHMDGNENYRGPHLNWGPAKPSLGR